MRLNRLFAVVAPIVLLLPLAAHADWPKGEREKYMAQCVPAAAQKIGDAKAKAAALAAPISSNRILPKTSRH